jgi:hypothetical protein
LKKLPRLLSQHAAHFAPFAFNSGDLHLIIERGLMTHPRDHRRLSSLLNGNALSSRDGSAADRSCVSGDGISQ